MSSSQKISSENFSATLCKSFNIFSQSLSVTLYPRLFMLLYALLSNITSDKVIPSSTNKDVLINVLTLSAFSSVNLIQAESWISLSLYNSLSIQLLHSCSVFVKALAINVSKFVHLTIHSSVKSQARFSHSLANTERTSSAISHQASNSLAII
jgi:hypothetical protein